MKHLSVVERTEILTQFIIDKGIYDRFVELLKRKPGLRGLSNRHAIRVHVANHSPSGPINGLCTWSLRKEGSDFWIALHREYNTLLNNGGQLKGCKSIW